MEDLVSTTRYVTWSLHNKVSIFHLQSIQMSMDMANPIHLMLHLKCLAFSLSYDLSQDFKEASNHLFLFSLLSPWCLGKLVY